jgi:hypothetical protein
MIFAIQVPTTPSKGEGGGDLQPPSTNRADRLSREAGVKRLVMTTGQASGGTRQPTASPSPLPGCEQHGEPTRAGEELADAISDVDRLDRAGGDVRRFSCLGGLDDIRCFPHL